MATHVHEWRLASGAEVNPAWWSSLGLPANLVRLCRTQPNRRTSARLNRMLADNLPLPPMPLRPRDGILDRGLNSAIINDLQLKAGGVWHAGRLKWLIENSQRARLSNELGIDVFPVAMRHSELASADSEPTDPSILADSIQHDGQRCWLSWLATQSAAVRSRLLLMLPPRSPVADNWLPEQKELGTAIFARLLEREGS